MIFVRCQEYEPEHCSFDIFPYLQQPPKNAHAEYSSGDRGQNFDLSSNYVYASSTGSGESAHLQKLT